MDYDRGGQAPTAKVTSHRGSQASTATSNAQHICRRAQRTSSLQQPTRTPTTTEARIHAHTYESAKIATKLIGSATAAQSDRRTTPNRLGPHPRDAARQAYRLVRLRQRQALRTSSACGYGTNWPCGAIRCQRGQLVQHAVRSCATQRACTPPSAWSPSTVRPAK